MTFLKYLFIFCLFSVVGWLLEAIYRGLVTKKFINPGFMSGCVVPLYGFGAVILNIVCNVCDKIDCNYRIILIFILSIILLSFLEFISGLILLKFFHLRLWDYSMYKYNYKGFICLEFSFVWGLLSLIFYIFIFPWLDSFSIIFVNNFVCLFILGIFMILFIADLCISIKLLSRLTKYAQSIKEILDVEKLKLDSRRRAKRKKLLNAIYPYISTNKFLKDKIKDNNN